MENSLWGKLFDSFNNALADVWGGFIGFTPKLILAILWFIVGWFLGGVLAKGIEELFKVLKIDRLFKSVGAEDLLRKANINLNSGYFVGQVAKWFVVIVFLIVSLNIVNLNSIAYFLQNEVLGFLPQVIVAVLVLVIASVLSDFLNKVIVASSRTMNIHVAKMLGSLAKYAVWIFAFIIALGQLGIAPQYMQILFTGIVAMMAIAGGIAFGLGGKEAAGRFIDKVSEEASGK